MSKSRYKDWLSQANEDLRWAKDTFDREYYPQTCFICQQATEKALKALAFKREFSQIKSHSIVKIAKALDINSVILSAGKKLDQYYISGRYPDAMPEGIPSEYISEEQAQEALELANTAIKKISELLVDDHEF